MATLNVTTLQTLIPSQFKLFATQNTIKFSYITAPTLRVAVLDSPVANADDEESPRIATVIVPQHRERDWIFGTESGHLQLLFHFNLSRLILIGNNVDPKTEPSVYIRPPVMNPVDKERLEEEVKSSVLVLYPKVCYQNGSPRPILCTYEDDVVYSVIIGKIVGPSVGEFLVEDVELEGKEFRRRLRFKRMPNLIQSQVHLVPKCGDGECNLGLGLESLRKMKEVEIVVDKKVLVEPYLNAMVSGIFLNISSIDGLIKLGIGPRALCLGVGGACLLSFLNTRLGFQVVGVEVDRLVVMSARQYFGFRDGTSVKLIFGDAIELLQKVANDTKVKIDGLNAKFDVVMVDLYSNEAKSPFSAPPPGFVSKPVFQAIKSLFHKHGVLVIHVVPPDKSFYKSLIQELKDVFHKVFEIDVKNDRDFVLMATLLTPNLSDDHANPYLQFLRTLISGSYNMDSIVEL